MKCLVVLSHLMSQNCDLGEESVARSKLAINHFSHGDYAFLMTLGWAYRRDCITPIANVVRDFILDNSSIRRSSVVSIPLSRDTVGDAYYCLDYVRRTSLSEVHVITSDYHVERTTLVFNKMLGSNRKVVIFGVKTKSHDNLKILKHEQQSIRAFLNTFDDVDFTSTRSIFNALATKHPYYNGEVYPKIHHHASTGAAH